MVVVEIAVTLKDVNMFHISLTHSLCLGNCNDAMDVGKDFPLIFLLIYLFIDTYLLPIGVSKPEIQTLLSSQLQQFCLIKGLQYSPSAQTPSSSSPFIIWLIDFWHYQSYDFLKSILVRLLFFY